LTKKTMPPPALAGFLLRSTAFLASKIPLD
jgi:hypothetical protein